MLEADVGDAGAESKSLRKGSRDGQPYEWVRAAGCLAPGQASAEKEVVVRDDPIQTDRLVSANLVAYRVQGWPQRHGVDFYPVHIDLAFESDRRLGKRSPS